MKNKLLLLLFAFSFTMITGCSDDNPVDNNNIIEDNSQSEEARYYAKYEVYMPLGGFTSQKTSRKITFVSENGEQTISTSNASWEGTYGPFKANTQLYLKAEAESGGIRNNVEYYVRLSVSYNKEPFTIKGEERGVAVSSLSTSYTIQDISE
ncbi:hypothetical protein [Bacteroides sp. An269]|uniref:hypothetical protein n=1 Tax=Bacteroides sp. An269 TaxID=1965613 RepID=UPI000B372CD7|nr:hypothetical protein [Bacteroides sp. An269]OUO83343.1 hypothetical protein B5F71_03355 [Bacteroides sp. An269]